MGLNITAMGSVLKNWYHGPTVEQLNNSSVVLSRIENRKEEWSGKVFYLPLHSGRNSGIGSRADGGDLPTAGSQSYDNAQYNASYQYGRLQITGPTIKASRNNRGSFLRAVDSEMAGLTKDLKQSVSRQVMRNGDGELTQCGDTSNATTVVVLSTKYIKEGMVVDIIDSATGSPITAGTAITVVTVPNATTFTIADAVTTDSADLVVLASTYIQDVYGLESIISQSNPPNAANLGGIDRSVSAGAFWQCATPVDYGSALTLALMQEAIDNVDIDSGSDTGLIVTSHKLKRDYAALLQANKRYPPGGEIKLDGGYRALEFSEVPLVADKDLETDSSGTTSVNLYFLDTSSIFVAHMGDWEWMEEDGAVLSRVSNKDAYEAVMFKYFQVVCRQGNANTYMYT